MTAPIVIKEEVVEPEVFERIVKEEPLEDEAQHIENTGDSPTGENEAQLMQGVKRRNVEYVEYAPHGYMPYHVYPPPSKMVRSEGRPMHPHAPYPMPHRMAQHPQFVYGPAAAMGQRKGPKPRHMAPMMVNPRGEMIYPTPAGLMPQSMRSPQVVPQQQMDPGARYVTVDPATGKQEVYMMVKMNEAAPRQSPADYSTPPYSVNPRPPKMITTPQYSSPQMRMVPGSAPAHAIVHQPGIKRAARAPKTAFTFPSLITLALLNAPGRKAVVTTIYDFLTEHFHGFNSVRANWRNSVRHALSYASFTKAEVSPDSTVERGIEWCFAEGRLEKLMEDVQRAVSQNEHTPEKLFLRKIENLPKILRGEMGVSRVSIIRVVGGQQEHILTPRHNKIFIQPRLNNKG